MQALWLTVSVLVFIALGGVILAWVNHHRLRRLQTHCQNQIQQLQNELAALNGSTVGLGQTLLALEKKLNQPATAAGESPSSGDDYRQLYQAIQQGGNAEKLADELGIPRAEARLLALLRNRVPQAS